MFRGLLRRAGEQRDDVMSGLLHQKHLVEERVQHVRLEFEKTGSDGIPCGRVRATGHQPDKSRAAELELERLRATRAQLVLQIETLEAAWLNADTLAAMEESVRASRPNQGLVHRLRRGDWRVLPPRSVQHRKERRDRT